LQKSQPPAELSTNHRIIPRASAPEPYFVFGKSAR
jgi:hypothetical protein